MMNSSSLLSDVLCGGNEMAPLLCGRRAVRHLLICEQMGSSLEHFHPLHLSSSCCAHSSGGNLHLLLSFSVCLSVYKVGQLGFTVGSLCEPPKESGKWH